MANLQALGSDNSTIVYLAANGEGTDQAPFKSIFASEQYGDWSVTLLNESLAVTGNFFPDIQAVSQSGAWTITVDNQLTGYATELKQNEILTELESIHNTLAATLTVNTSLNQPVTDSELRATPLNVNQTSLPGLRIPDHNQIDLSYTGSNLTSVIYRLNGSIVAILTLVYTDNNLTSVIRS